MKKLYFILFAALAAAASCSKNDPTPSLKTPEMIDLGLSVKWASFNVGATAIEEYGTYFAWGDVTGQTWDGTKWSGGGFLTAPEFEVDANGRLKPEYDAAHVNLGGDWRMPTMEEQQALIDNCTSTWVADYQGTGVAGRLFASKINGNSIFMPAAGGGDGTELHDVASHGKYWSCTFGDKNAWYLRFSSKDIVMYNYPRHYGRPVRAVVDKSAIDPSVVTDLSASCTANCYIVPAAGYYKFKATVKGNSTESVGTPATAEVLWESFGTSVTPSKGDIVKSVSLESGYVKFSTPSTLANGNAVVAVKDVSGDILWSWHIWVCKDFYPSASAQVYNNNAGTMMDRNLGATSSIKGDVHSLGLMYQWGRKDPFLGSGSISNSTPAKSTLSWPSLVSSSSSTGTIDYAVKNPTTYIKYNLSNYDWYYTGSSQTDNTRWQTSDKEKGIYDPCPAGWRIPDGGISGVWSIAFDNSYSWKSPSNWDSTNMGIDFGVTYKTLGSGTIWYPASGFILTSSGSLDSVGEYGGYWSCTPIGSDAYDFYINDEGSVYPVDNYRRAGGQSVRCQCL